jgi:hypothetical protein
MADCIYAVGHFYFIFKRQNLFIQKEIPCMVSTKAIRAHNAGDVSKREFIATWVSQPKS